MGRGGLVILFEDFRLFQDSDHHYDHQLSGDPFSRQLQLQL